MTKMKGLLLGAAAGLVTVASAQAADLPVKAAPVEYVRVCSLYGAGFFYIPGTDTCLKIGGYLRADFAFIEPTKVFFPTVNATGAVIPGVGIAGRGTASGTILNSANRNATTPAARARSHRIPRRPFSRRLTTISTPFSPTPLPIVCPAARRAA